MELDRGLLPVLAETLAGYPNAEVVPATRSNSTSPRSCGALPRYALPGLRDLPYNVTTPFSPKFIDAGIFEAITVMIQREVALSA